MAAAMRLFGKGNGYTKPKHETGKTRLTFWRPKSKEAPEEAQGLMSTKPTGSAKPSDYGATASSG